MTQETEDLQDQLQNALNELDDAKDKIASLKHDRDTLEHALRQLVAEVHNKCPGIALPTLLNAREALLKIS